MMNVGESSESGGGGFEGIPFGINPIQTGTQEPFCYLDGNDPRLGRAQRKKKMLYDELNLGNPNDDDPDDYSEEEDDSKRPVTITHSDSFPYTEAEMKQYQIDYATAWRRRLNLAVKNEAKTLSLKDSRSAHLAMQFYNRIHGTGYEVHQTLGSFSRIYAGVWTHCNFQAAVPGGSGSTRTFFAELNRKTRTYNVKSCIVIDDHPSDVVLGCKICGDKLLHPCNNFQVGK